ncbi:PfkB family carbohydrate kinase [Arthrobacter zhangbolii]|uniref:PfkB family carbohydrate kinase n=1 Tax=Arthrobacter zhangbolii TaxID=2886936 RepID=A0A9X1M761_9MICC|nr:MULTISPECIES: PfkB family carbohydrate kinase [Arthrobacter]MCC3272266.1 PfkB family carbohydrate kinase [Arthrobacter zhangbolii]MDN3903330.1 PfkB family carbohydrate kinase [Arthrobacter sp. YD2]UON91868.1 PfkB family carbohydrate kinase [Arthrobacter zhangbolii]
MIAFCGYANRDVIVQMDVLPSPGERLQARSIRLYDGGMAANAAVAAARFGADAVFAGAVGADPESAAFLAALEREGVSTAWSRTDAFLTHAVVLLDRHGERAVVSEDDALTGDDLEAVLGRLHPGSGHWLYVDGYRWEQPLPARTEARIVVDIDGCHTAAQVRNAAAAAGHLLGSRRTFEDTCGLSLEELQEMSRREETTIVLTRGAGGLDLLEPGRPVRHIPAVRVEAVDDTGAGDCFAGVYVAELALGQTAAAAATTAAAAAALACTRRGARASPGRAELRDFLATLQTVPATHGTH